ncbi:regulatory-associated of mTOR isoform X2, partial [Brachionus plicatilis]
YRLCPDPTSEDVKKLCVSLRKNAKEERVLFHYNGHGVPRPTVNGEIWVFNKEFTQYIPLSLYEVQTWMGTPSIYVWECSNAGLIVQSFLSFESDREAEFKKQMEDAESVAGCTSVPNFKDSIHLAACSASELLPQHPDLPVDLFTSCLTTPIKTALYWYVTQKHSCQLIPGLTLDLLEKIPGQISDRRTMMGELNWIFTAITDTIAWNLLDSDLFQKLFRQDLLVASLFRNYLLAERIIKSFDCAPVSHPPLPATSEHPLWQSWDLALDMCISQLPRLFDGQGNQTGDFVSCGFFSQQIEIFELWLKLNVSSERAPEQLPVVLQVLLSQQHRLKALELLAKFIDLGAWAVSAALSVGIFPYVLKLLSTQPKELRPLLTFIWAKILAVDRSCQAELVKDSGHVYFIQMLSESEVEPDQKVYSAFVLASLVHSCPLGQRSAKQSHLIAACSFLLTDEGSRDYAHTLLRKWVCICLGLCWLKYPEARWEGVRNNAHLLLKKLIVDPAAEVRAAAVFALGTYIDAGHGKEGTFEQAIEIDSQIVSSLIKSYDCVFLVRKELIVALHSYINRFCSESADCGKQTKIVFAKAVATLFEMQSDPYPECAALAQRVLRMNHHLINKFENLKKMSEAPPAAGDTDDADLDTGLVAWSSNYFLRPLLASHGPDRHQPLPVNRHVDLYSSEKLDQHCKLLYNYKTRRTPSQWSQPAQMEELLQIQHQPYPIHVKFNPNNEQIFVADIQNNVTVYDSVNRTKLLSFSSSRKPAIIRSFKLINTQHEPIILTGSDDLAIKFFKPDLHNLKQTQLITAFTAFNSVRESTIEAGLIVEWDEANEMLMCAGDTNYIRVWDMNKELYKDYLTELKSCVSSLSCGDSFTIAGFGNGCVKLFDFRSPSGAIGIVHSDSVSSFMASTPVIHRTNSMYESKYSYSNKLYAHNSFVLKTSVHVQENTLVSSGVLGDITVYDLRYMKKAIDKSFNNEKASALECHPVNRLIAVANSTKQNESIKIYNFEGAELSCIKHREGFMGKRLSTVSCIDWNPNSNEILFGSFDNLISVFRRKDNQYLNNIY